MRRKIFFVLAALAACFLPLVSHAQTITTVSGTIVDPSGLPYAGGQLTATVVPPNGGVSPFVTATGAPLIAPTVTNLNLNGSFSVGLVANASITPASTHYTFRLCAPFVQPPLGSGTQSCFTITGVTIAGATQDLTTTLKAAAPALTNAPYLVKIFTLTSAQILAIGTTPVAILPAPGANETYVVLGSLAECRFNSTKYTISGLGTIALLFGNAYASNITTWIVSNNMTGFIDQTNNTYTQGIPPATSSMTNPLAESVVVNQPLNILGDGNPTLGNGTITITLYYTIVNTLVTH